MKHSWVWMGDHGFYYCMNCQRTLTPEKTPAFVHSYQNFCPGSPMPKEPDMKPITLIDGDEFRFELTFKVQGPGKLIVSDSDTNRMTQLCTFALQSVADKQGMTVSRKDQE